MIENFSSMIQVHRMITVVSSQIRVCACQTVVIMTWNFQIIFSGLFSSPVFPQK